MARPLDNAQLDLYQVGVDVQNDYRLDPGVCVLPVAEDPPDASSGQLAAWSPVAVLRLHAPYRVRRAKYREEKQNNPPVAPAPGDTGAFVFVGGSIAFTNQLNSTFRNYDWVVGAEYVYVENCVSRNEDGFVLGLAPWTWDTTTLNLQNGGLTIPQFGAVAQGGPDVLVGFLQGQLAVNGQTGDLNAAWGYNTTSYYPGTFLSDDLTNGGQPVV